MTLSHFYTLLRPLRLLSTSPKAHSVYPNCLYVKDSENYSFSHDNISRMGGGALGTSMYLVLEIEQTKKQGHPRQTESL